MRWLLVDGIERVESGRAIAGWKNAAMAEDYLEWHFPDRPIVPGSLVLEAFAQLAGWHEAQASSFVRWVLLDRVSSARYFGVSVPGDRIDLRVEVLADPAPDRRAYRGESTVRGERRALVEFEGRVVDVEALDGRERVERLYRTLRGEASGRDAPGTPR